MGILGELDDLVEEQVIEANREGLEAREALIALGLTLAIFESQEVSAILNQEFLDRLDNVVERHKEGLFVSHPAFIADVLEQIQCAQNGSARSGSLGGLIADYLELEKLYRAVKELYDEGSPVALNVLLAEGGGPQLVIVEDQGPEEPPDDGGQDDSEQPASS